MAYSLVQMQSLLRQAGWPEKLIVTMAAIGMAESSGRECVTGRLAKNEYSVGLWQININPALKRPWTEKQLCDPLFNAKAAFEIYRQQGLRAWGAYRDGRYQQYIPQSQAAYMPNATPVVVIAEDGDELSAVYQDSMTSLPGSTRVLIGLGIGAALLWALRR